MKHGVCFKQSASGAASRKGQPRFPVQSDFTRDAATPLNGTFPYYSDGVVGESYGAGHYKATNGRLYKVTASGTGTPLAWYPVPGYRHSNSGALGDVGNRGYSWSSAISGTSGVFLYFLTQGLTPSTAHGRGHGFPLRCLSHPKGVLMAAATPFSVRAPENRWHKKNIAVSTSD